MPKKLVHRLFLLLKIKPQKICSLTFLGMISKYYANYIELVITNNCSTDSYVGRRRVYPSTVYWFVSHMPWLPVLCSKGNCHFTFHLGCWTLQNKIPVFFPDRVVYKNVFCGKCPAQKGFPATALLQWKENSTGTWNTSPFMHFCICSLEGCQNRLNLW